MDMILQSVPRDDSDHALRSPIPTPHTPPPPTSSTMQLPTSSIVLLSTYLPPPPPFAPFMDEAAPTATSPTSLVVVERGPHRESESNCNKSVRPSRLKSVLFRFLSKEHPSAAKSLKKNIKKYSFCGRVGHKCSLDQAQPSSFPMATKRHCLDFSGKLANLSNPNLNGTGRDCSAAPPGIMKILAWNCRGCRGPSIINHLHALIRSSSPSFVFLSETKCSQAQAKPIIS